MACPVGVTVLATVVTNALAATETPLRLVTDSAPVDLGAVVRVGAAIAAAGVLLNLIPGVSRTTLAMARGHDLPHWFARIDPGRWLPLRAELTVAAAVIVLIVAIDLRNAIAVSGVAVLAYYAITNAAALTLGPTERRWPRAVAATGFGGCVLLIAALPVSSLVGGFITLGTGVAVRTIAAHRHGS